MRLEMKSSLEDILRRHGGRPAQIFGWDSALAFVREEYPEAMPVQLSGALTTFREAARQKTVCQRCAGASCPFGGLSAELVREELGRRVIYTVRYSTCYFCRKSGGLS